MKTITGKLAEYICSLSFEMLPADVADMAKKCIFDCFGNMYGGYSTSMGEKILRYTESYSEIVEGEPKICRIGGGKVSRKNAVMVHAVIARCTDLDDGHRYAMGHPGSVVIPAAMAAGELYGKSAREVLTAVTAAYDVYCRVGAAINPSSYRERGFDATGIVGALACAAAVGKLAGLSREEMAWALGIAGSFSGGLIEYQNDGTMGKVLCGCWAIETGWRAVTLACRGFTGPEAILEGKKGFVQAFSNAPELSGILKELGADFRIRETYFKVHACMRGLHAAVDAILSLRERQGLQPEEVERITVRTTPFVGRLSNPRPQTLIGAQCSVEFSLAAALKAGHLGREETLSEAMEDEKVFALAEKIRLEMDPEIEEYVRQHPSHWAAVRLEVHKKTGECMEAWSPLPAGEAENPFGWERLYQKFQTLLEGTPYEEEGERLYHQFRHFEELESWEKLYEPKRQAQ